ncbi:MAG: VOC family protein [Candidatus Accumulibacter sp. UW26]|jgi:predicted enzyme related to lactoylglutathione lyase
MDKPGNAVGWFEIYVLDMARARAFYSTVFGREMIALHSIGEGSERYAFSWIGGAAGAAGALVRQATVSPGKGGTLVYFSCDDVADEASRVLQAGGRVIQPKMAIGQYGHTALIEDTEGNLIGLHSLQ